MDHKFSTLESINLARCAFGKAVEKYFLMHLRVYCLG